MNREKHQGGQRLTILLAICGLIITATPVSAGPKEDTAHARKAVAAVNIIVRDYKNSRDSDYDSDAKIAKWRARMAAVKAIYSKIQDKSNRRYSGAKRTIDQIDRAIEAKIKYALQKRARAAKGGGSSGEMKKIKETLAKLDRRWLKQASLYFDGTKVLIYANGRIRNLNNLGNSVVSDVRWAKRKWKNVPSSAKSTAEGVAVGKRLDYWVGFVRISTNDVRKVQKELKKRVAALKALCDEFNAEVMDKNAVRAITALRDNRIPSSKAMSIAEFIAVTKKIATACKKPKYKESCGYMKTISKPLSTCEMAFKAAKQIPGLIKKNASRTVERLIKHKRKQLDNLERNEGYIKFQTGDNMFENPDKFKKRTAEKVKAAYTQAGLKVPTDLMADFDAFINEFWQKAEELAPKWKFSKREAKHKYVERIAKKALQKEGYSVLKTVISRKKWRIHRDALGRIVSRSRVGHALAKRPKARSGKLCAQIEWTYNEDYQRGRYKKTSIVRTGWRRFLKCR